MVNCVSWIDQGRRQYPAPTLRRNLQKAVPVMRGASRFLAGLFHPPHRMGKEFAESPFRALSPGTERGHSCPRVGATARDVRCRGRRASWEVGGDCAPGGWPGPRRPERGHSCPRVGATDSRGQECPRSDTRFTGGSSFANHGPVPALQKAEMRPVMRDSQASRLGVRRDSACGTRSRATASPARAGLHGRAFAGAGHCASPETCGSSVVRGPAITLSTSRISDARQKCV